MYHPRFKFPQHWCSLYLNKTHNLTIQFFFFLNLLNMIVLHIFSCFQALAFMINIKFQWHGLGYFCNITNEYFLAIRKNGSSFLALKKTPAETRLLKQTYCTYLNIKEQQLEIQPCDKETLNSFLLPKVVNLQTPSTIYCKYCSFQSQDFVIRKLLLHQK